MTRINQNKWKDRGWWVSVDIDRKPSGRKKEDLALNLLGKARERYDLLLENGNTVSRGPFNAADDMRGLARLLAIANQWAGTIVYHRGNLLGTADAQHLSRLLTCAANQACCRTGSKDQRLAYLGCHRQRIGLMNYSLASMKKNDIRYWFAFLRREKKDYQHAFLDKSALPKAMEPARLCPRFPAQTPAIIEMLPAAVSLKPANKGLFWVPTRYKIRTRRLCRYPPVVPNSEVMYREWIGHLLHEIPNPAKPEMKNED
jgi:hypothetical protein